MTAGGAVAGGAAGGAAAGAGAAAAADEEVNRRQAGKRRGRACSRRRRALLMKPSRTMEEVAVFLSLPGIESNTETLPGQLLGYLLGQESKGSLTAELVKRGWATARARGWTRTWRRSIMGVQISLTKKGVAHWEEVWRCCTPKSHC